MTESGKIGKLVDKMHEVRERKRLAEDAVKAIEEEYAKLEAKLVEMADEQGITGGKGKAATFVISDSVVPQVTDWGKLYKFIYREGYGHLLERRPSVVACRELWDTKGAIPGVEKFTKRRVNLRTN